MRLLYSDLASPGVTYDAFRYRTVGRELVSACLACRAVNSARVTAEIAAARAGTSPGTCLAVGSRERSARTRRTVEPRLQQQRPRVCDPRGCAGAPSRFCRGGGCACDVSPGEAGLRPPCSRERGQAPAVRRLLGSRPPPGSRRPPWVQRTVQTARQAAPRAGSAAHTLVSMFVNSYAFFHAFIHF